MLIFLPFIPFLFFFSVIFGGIAFGLAVTGGPGECDAGGSGPIVINAANAASFQQKWDAFDAALDSGSPASVTFNESEVSSRAREHLFDDADNSADQLDGPRICLHDGYGEASARVDLPGFLDIKMKMKAHAKITDELEIEVDDIDVGNVPGFFIGWTNVEDIDGTVTDVHLKHHYVLTLREGEAQVDGTP